MIKETLTKRIISGLLMLFLSMWYIFYVSENTFVLITYFLASIGIFEFQQALKRQVIQLQLLGLLLCNTFFYLTVWSFITHIFPFIYPLIGTLISVIITYFWEKKKSQQKAIKWILISLIWISFPLSLTILIRFTFKSHLGEQFLFIAMSIISLNDTFAYFGGKRYGKHLLAPKISPKKTIEGSLFGVIGGMVGVYLSCYLLQVVFKFFYTNIEVIHAKDFLPHWFLILMVIVLVPFSQIGDLVESKFKRHCSIKDSSHLIPGHGGFLDRFDAHLLALPILYLLLFLLNMPV